MNDNELDELLNTRKTSPTPASLRERVPVGIVVRHKRLSRQRFLVAAAAVSAVVFLLTIPPRSPRR